MTKDIMHIYSEFSHISKDYDNICMKTHIL